MTKGKTPPVDVPPHNLDAERSVLGCQLLDSECVPTVRAIISPEDFHVPDHRDVQRVIYKIHDAGAKADVVTVAASFDDIGRFEEIGGAFFLGELLRTVPYTTHVEHYARIVAEESRRRRTIDLGRKLMHLARDHKWSESKIYEDVAAAAQQLSELRSICAPSSRAVIRSMAEVEKRELQWLWPARIPLGKLTLIGGDPGLGKSHLTVDITARVTRGDNWPDGSANAMPGSVLVFNSEDDPEDTIVPRSERAGADLGKIHFVEKIVSVDARTGEQRDSEFSLERDLPYLENWLRDTPDARLITIDPISAYCGSVDSHKNAEVRGMLAPLVAMAARYGVAVVCVTHLSKGVGGKAVYRAMGSLAFAAAARAVWTVSRDLDDPDRRLLLPAKMNLCKEPDGLAFKITDGFLTWEADAVSMTADEYLTKEAEKTTEKARTKRDDAKDWLMQAIGDRKRPASELLDEGIDRGYSSKMIRKAFTELQGAREKDGFNAGWVWSLPNVTSSNTQGNLGNLRESSATFDTKMPITKMPIPYEDYPLKFEDTEDGQSNAVGHVQNSEALFDATF